MVSHSSEVYVEPSIYTYSSSHFLPGLTGLHGLALSSLPAADSLKGDSLLHPQHPAHRGRLTHLRPEHGPALGLSFFKIIDKSGIWRSERDLRGLVVMELPLFSLDYTKRRLSWGWKALNSKETM